MDNEQNMTDLPHTPSPTTGLAILASFILFIASLFLVYFECNRVGSLTLESGSYADSEAVQDIVGDPRGHFLPFMDKEGIKEKICALTPLVADVSIELRFPRRLYIRVIDETYAYYLTGANGTILLLNDDLKILGVHDQKVYNSGEAGYDLNDMTELLVKNPKDLTIGKQLNFDGQEELAPFLSALKKEKGRLYTHLNVLDISNLRDIVVIFDNLVRIELSEYTDAELKLQAIEAMMQTKKTREEECPTCFVYVNPRKGSVYWAVKQWTNLFDDYPEHQ